MALRSALVSGILFAAKVRLTEKANCPRGQGAKPLVRTCVSSERTAGLSKLMLNISISYKAYALWVIGFFVHDERKSDGCLVLCIP